MTPRRTRGPRRQPPPTDAPSARGRVSSRPRLTRRDVGPLLGVLAALALGTLPLYWATLADVVAPLPPDAQGAAALAALRRQADAPVVTMHRSPTCGCCLRWAAHLRAAGFRVVVVDREHLPAVRRAHGVPDSLAACHTATVAGYVVEGHVPAADVARLVVSRPPIRGLALPGMPRGSPGMESALRTRFAVRAFDSSGAAWVVARH